MRARTTAREAAITFLYLLDLRGNEVTGGLEEFLKRKSKVAAVRDFARALVEGCESRREELDRLIVSVAHNWSLSRMSAIDRNVLRLGAYELVSGGETPPKVVINEAVDLAKRFGGTDSGKFVNGILDGILAVSRQFKIERSGKVSCPRRLKVEC